MSPEELPEKLAKRYADILGPHFVGMYVHGSCALGCFNPSKSDLDYIIVCDNEPDSMTRRAIMDATLAYSHVAPAKGLEMHLMHVDDCRAYVHPPRFLGHYSDAHKQAYLEDPEATVGRLQGRDIDLGAHLTVMYARGKRICGPEIREIFGPVPPECYLESILDDAGWSDGDAMYHVLNRCRTLAFVRDGLVLSKKEGGEWALKNLDFGGDVVEEALECYAGGRTMPPSGGARRFCAVMLDIIQNEARRFINT